MWQGSFFQKTYCFIVEMWVLHFSAELSTEKVDFLGSSWSILHKCMGASILEKWPCRKPWRFTFNVVSLLGTQTIFVKSQMISIHLRRRLHGFVVLNSRLHDIDTFTTKAPYLLVSPSTNSNKCNGFCSSKLKASWFSTSQMINSVRFVALNSKLHDFRHLKCSIQWVLQL